MALIFVNTENPPENKLFRATKAGSSAAKAEEKMQKTVLRIFGKAPGFTTNKAENAKGYSIRISVAKVEIVGPDTKCSLSGELLRYPAAASVKEGDKEEMVSTSMAGNGKATGKGEGALLDCVEAIIEEMCTKRCMPAMRMDFAKR
jgi:hypothetical protein